MTLTQADQILDRGMIRAPQAIVDQKSLSQIGLNDNSSIHQCYMRVIYLY